MHAREREGSLVVFILWFFFFFFFLYFWTLLLSMQDLSSLTRDQTCAPCSGSWPGVLATGLQGSLRNHVTAYSVPLLPSFSHEWISQDSTS